ADFDRRDRAGAFVELDAPCADGEPAFVRGRGARRRIRGVFAPEAFGHDVGIFPLRGGGGFAVGRRRRDIGGGRGAGPVVGRTAAGDQQRGERDRVDAHVVLRVRWSRQRRSCGVRTGSTGSQQVVPVTTTCRHR